MKFPTGSPAGNFTPSPPRGQKSKVMPVETALMVAPPIVSLN
jgi:hypothetical protein